MPPAATSPTAPDPVASLRLERRLARQAEAPWLHGEVARRMAERLQVFRQQPDRWLDWHGTQGGSAQALQTTLPQARRAVSELDDEAVARAQSLVAGPWWRRWLPEAARADAQVRRDDDWGPASTPMLWANMVLHRAARPDDLLRRWHELLTPDGFVMFSTLGPQTCQALRALYQAHGWGEPLLPFVDMHDIGDAMVQAGFADPVMDQEQLTLSWSSPHALLQELRTMGANLSPLRHSGLRTPRWREALCQALSGLAGPDGRITLGFELVYGHAYKGQPRAAPGQPVPISLAQLRRPTGGPS